MTDLSRETVAQGPSAHGPDGLPSPWVMRFSAMIPAGGEVLDLACGSGRHALALAQAGFVVEGVDRNGDALERLRGVKGVTTRLADLEHGAWPFGDRTFDAVIVTNYLFRERFDLVLALLRTGSVLIYETFMFGNAQFGKPSNLEFLLAPNELLQRCTGMHVVAFEQGVVSTPRMAAIQRICAIQGAAGATLLP